MEKKRKAIKNGFKKEPEKEKFIRTELELEQERAKEELEESLRIFTQKEYKNKVRELRDQVLDFIQENPKMPLSEVAEQFGIREHTIRAWKAHCTMGTYEKENQRRSAGNSVCDPEPAQEKLFGLNKKKQRKFGFVLRKRHTSFIHYFDKTPPGIICPHFYILAFANGCPYKCDYCYLNLTLRHWPEPTVFANTARMFQEIRDWIYATEKPSVLNAGELSDSLVWDKEIKLTQSLIPIFASQNKHKLLLLTKSANISELAKLTPSDSVITSFSLNSQEVSNKYEKKSPPPSARLNSAKTLKQLGFRVRLRIDPIIPIPNWKEGYTELIEQINNIAPETITLGTLRFFPALKHRATGNKEVFNYAVDNNDPDARWRLPIDQRIEIYTHFFNHLTPAIKKIGLCKETLKVHQILNLNHKNPTCNCSYD